MTNVHFYLAGYFCSPSTFVYLTVCLTQMLLRLLLSGRGPSGQDFCELPAGYLPLWGPTPSTKETFAYSILQFILGALASPGIHIDPVLPQAAFVSQGMSEAPIYDFHFSKKPLGSLCSGAFEAPFTTLLLGKGFRLTVTPQKFLRALSVLIWAEGHNS